MPVHLTIIERLAEIPRSPYARFGLYRNPFGELTREERAQLAVVDTGGFREFLGCDAKRNRDRSPLHQARRAVQFYGDCGYGKTTHLLALEAAVTDSVFVYFPQFGPKPNLPQARLHSKKDNRAFRLLKRIEPLREQVPQDQLLIVDEAQRMGWTRRRQMLGWPGALAIGTHQDLSRQLKRAGFEVLPINVEDRKQPTELAQILNRRIEASRLTDAAVEPPWIEIAEAARLIEVFDSNLRAIEQALFTKFQKLVSEAAHGGVSIAY